MLVRSDLTVKEGFFARCVRNALLRAQVLSQSVSWFLACSDRAKRTILNDAQLPGCRRSIPY